MKIPNKLTFTLAVTTTLMLATSSASAATLITSTFSSVGLTTDQDIDVTGSNVVDWGYYDQSQNFVTTGGTVDNKKAVSGIGTVSVAPGAITNATANSIAADAKFTMTFLGGDSPAMGTVEIGAGLGAWGGTEDNAATFTFNDLGAGTHTVRVFAGHTTNDRIFDMDYSVTATDGNLSSNTLSNSISSGSLHSTYELVFSTTDALSDLTLQFNSTSGGAGSGWIGGYVVETTPIPEPSAAVLSGLGLLALLRRRR